MQIGAEAVITREGVISHVNCKKMHALVVTLYIVEMLRKQNMSEKNPICSIHICSLTMILSR